MWEKERRKSNRSEEEAPCGEAAVLTSSGETQRKRNEQMK